MTIRSFGEKKPTLSKGVYVDEDAVVIGDVRLEEDVTIWPGAVLRADDDSISVGRDCAFMDVSFAEAPKGRPVTVGQGCIISHGARLHGCTIDSEVLVGVGAIVLDSAHIGMRSVVAAGTVVAPGTEIPPGSLVMGIPGKTNRQTRKADLDWLKTELEAIKKKVEVYRGKK